MKIKRALLSVSDKQGIVDFARFLHEQDVEIISTGGTMEKIKKAGIPVTYVSDVTGFPEIMDGRVKTLNPFIHGGILAVRKDQKHQEQMQEHGIKPIDMVVVNLYPFRETIAKPNCTEEDAIENIDIGGPAMIRAAAKNFTDVTIIVNPLSYEKVTEAIKSNGEVSLTLRKELAQEAFRHTSEYDAAICDYMLKTLAPKEEYLTETAIFLSKVQDLRYGENPHQTAAFYREKGVNTGIAYAKQLHGKELSFNNIVDVESAYRIVSEFTKPAVTIIKHTNPCGTGIGKSLVEAYKKAFEADTVSAFGGIIGLNRTVDLATAQEMSKLFVEVVIAPRYDKDALVLLMEKKNIRLLESPLLDLTKSLDMKKVSGGMLIQQLDDRFVEEKDLQVVTRRQPTKEEIEQMLFAMKIVKHVKSNAIVLAKDFQTIGIGAGQMNRVGSADIAIKQSGDLVQGSVLASDAFLPFADTVELAAKVGITAIIQPGGSVRDEESIIAADKHNIAMIFTGMRHFKH